MVDLGRVRGSEGASKPLIISKDTVYVHTDIQKIVEIMPDGTEWEVWEYNEVQYDKDEYLELVVKQKNDLQAELDLMQVAMLENTENISDMQMAIISLNEKGGEK